jgi:hypothetical protein
MIAIIPSWFPRLMLLSSAVLCSATRHRTLLNSGTLVLVHLTAMGTGFLPRKPMVIVQVVAGLHPLWNNVLVCVSRFATKHAFHIYLHTHPGGLWSTNREKWPLTLKPTFFDVRTVNQYGAMNAYEAIRLKLLCHG